MAGGKVGSILELLARGAKGLAPSAQADTAILRSIPFRSSASRYLNQQIDDLTLRKLGYDAVFGADSRHARAPDIASKGLQKLMPTPWGKSPLVGAVKETDATPSAIAVAAPPDVTQTPDAGYLFDLASFNRGAGQDLMKSSILDSDEMVGNAKNIFMTPSTLPSYAASILSGLALRKFRTGNRIPLCLNY